jgi:hypothetical protein
MRWTYSIPSGRRAFDEERRIKMREHWAKGRGMSHDKIAFLNLRAEIFVLTDSVADTQRSRRPCRRDRIIWSLQP